MDRIREDLLEKVAAGLENIGSDNVMALLEENYTPRGFTLKRMARLVLDFMFEPGADTPDTSKLIQDELQGNILIILTDEKKVLCRNNRYLIKADGTDFPTLDTLKKEDLVQILASQLDFCDKNVIDTHFYMNIAVDSFEELKSQVDTLLQELVNIDHTVLKDRNQYKLGNHVGQQDVNYPEQDHGEAANGNAESNVNNHSTCLWKAELPGNYIEAISGDNTWETFGIQIKWTEPTVPGNIRLAVNEPVRLRLCVETRRDLEVPPEDLTAWCWTHIRKEDNPCGIWKEVKLDYNPRCTQWNDSGITSYVFQSAIVPTKDDVYILNFSVKYDTVVIWANHFGVENNVDIQVKSTVNTQTVSLPLVHVSGCVSREATESNIQKREAVEFETEKRGSTELDKVNREATQIEMLSNALALSTLRDRSPDRKKTQMD